MGFPKKCIIFHCYWPGHWKDASRWLLCWPPNPHPHNLCKPLHWRSTQSARGGRPNCRSRSIIISCYSQSIFWGHSGNNGVIVHWLWEKEGRGGVKGEVHGKKQELAEDRNISDAVALIVIIRTGGSWGRGLDHFVLLARCPECRKKGSPKIQKKYQWIVFSYTISSSLVGQSVTGKICFEAWTFFRHRNSSHWTEL